MGIIFFLPPIPFFVDYSCIIDCYEWQDIHSMGKMDHMSKDESALFFFLKFYILQTLCGSSSRVIILPITKFQNILLLTLFFTNQTNLSVFHFQALTHVPIGSGFITPVI